MDRIPPRTAMRRAVLVMGPGQAPLWADLGGEGDGVLPPMPSAPRSEGLTRLVAQIELLGETLAPAATRTARA